MTVLIETTVAVYIETTMTVLMTMMTTMMMHDEDDDGDNDDDDDDGDVECDDSNLITLPGITIFPTDAQIARPL